MDMIRQYNTEKETSEKYSDISLEIESFPHIAGRHTESHEIIVKLRDLESKLAHAESRILELESELIVHMKYKLEYMNLKQVNVSLESTYHHLNSELKLCKNKLQAREEESQQTQKECDILIKRVSQMELNYSRLHKGICFFMFCGIYNGMF